MNTRDETKEIYKEAYREIQGEQNEERMTFSTCSENGLRTYLSRIHYQVELGGTLPATEMEFLPFVWLDQEEKDTPRARDHLEAQLSRFGVQFGDGQYQLYDVHTKANILNVDDRKTGKLTGGTDLILGPHGLHVFSTTQQSCVLFELKTRETIEKKKGFGHFIAQATLELIAANYYSNQMAVVVLTDLYSGASVFTLKRNESETTSVILYENLTVSQAVQFTVDHLTEYCVPLKSYNLQTGRRPVDIDLRAMKQSRVSQLEDSVEWEQFQDMLQDCPPCTRERAEVINQLYRSCDFPQPAYLSMFV